MLLGVYGGINARKCMMVAMLFKNNVSLKLYFSNVYFCEVYPTCFNPTDHYHHNFEEDDWSCSTIRILVNDN